MRGNLKHLAKELADDLDEVMDALDQSWWETGIELVPVLGDAYGVTMFGKRTAYAWKRMQEIENKYVEKVYNSLGENQAKKFKKRMRNAGVRDARKDQKAGVENGEKYFGDGNIEGHHKKSVSENPDKMTDPSNIEMMRKEDHIKLHKGDLELIPFPKTKNLDEVIVSRERIIYYLKPPKNKN